MIKIALDDKAKATVSKTADIGVGTTVIANPELSGTENNLTGLQVGGTKYKVPQGSGGQMEIVTLNYVLDEQLHNITQEQATKLQNGAILTNEDGNVYSLSAIQKNGSILAYQCIIFNDSFAQIKEVDGIVISLDSLLYQCIKLGQQL